MKIEPLLVTPEEAARLLSLSRSTVFEELKANKLRRVKKGRATLIPYEDVKRYAEDLIAKSA